MSLLDNMKLFVRVTELGSLSAAGRDLRVSPAVASHRLKELENYLVKQEKRLAESVNRPDISVTQ